MMILYNICPLGPHILTIGVMVSIETHLLKWLLGGNQNAHTRASVPWNNVMKCGDILINDQSHSSNKCATISRNHPHNNID